MPTTSLLLFCCCLPALPPAEHPIDFCLQGTVLEAMEGGPVVVLVVLSHKGDKPVRYWHTPSSRVSVTVPREWTFRLRIVGVCGLSGAAILEPKGEKREVVYLHHRYSDIVAGRATVRLTWPLCTPDRKKLIACPATRLEITIPPATPKNLEKLRDRLLKKVRPAGATAAGKFELYSYLEYTQHAALAPVTWLMIESWDDPVRVSYLLDDVYARSTSAPEVDARLVALVHSPRWRQQEELFDYWRSRKRTVVAGEMERLKASSDVWVKVLTFVTFPDRCEKLWRQSLFACLQEQGQSPSGARVDRLVRRLDADDFMVRERATAELMRFGDRVVPPLRATLRRKLTLEAKRRVESVLEAIANQKPSPQCAAALSFLDRLRTPEADATLRILAKGKVDTWVMKQAKAALARREKQPAP